MFNYKSLTDEDLKDIFEGIEFAIEPMRHQYITMAHVLDNDLQRTCLFHDIGTGKTLTALWINMLWKARKTLVVCPRSAFRGWRRDIGNYTDFSYVILEGEKATRILNLENDYDIYIINYEGLKSIYGKLKSTSIGTIDTFENEYKFLSNFHMSPILWNEMEWPTVENAFQAAKSNDPEVREYIKKAETPNEAKRLGRRIQLSFRKNWDNIRVEIMEEIVKLKFLQNINLATKLIETDNTMLVEGNNWHDNFWGNCICKKKCENIKGKNVLGNILMDVRKELGGCGKPGRTWKIDPSSFIDKFDCLILDEVHKCTSYDSIQTKLCYKLSQRAKYAIGLTGTPLRRNLLSLWSLMRVIDLGAHLGLNFFKFRNRYFKQNWQDWIPLPGTLEKILDRILPAVTSFKREECIDLPEAMYEVLEVEASPRQRKAIDDIMEGLLVEVNNGTINNGNVLTRTQKVREITGGFLYTKGGDGKRETYVFPDNPKLEAVEDVVTSTGYKIIIFHQYEEEGRILERWAKKKKIGYASMRGEIKDKDAEFDRFINDDNTRLLFAHPQTASESLDMTVTFIMVFYSTGGFIDRWQAEGRIRRKHQHRKQLYVDIVVRDSPDEVAIERIEEQKKLSERFLEYIRNYGKKKVDNDDGKATLFN